MKNLIADTIFELSDLLYKLHTQITNSKTDTQEVSKILRQLKKSFGELFMLMNQK